MNDFQFFLPIAKVDKDKRTVSGYASTPTKDSDGEIVTLDAVRNALPDYMAWGNIREMHKLSAVGVAEEANVDSKGLFLTAKIVDDVAWQKCIDKVYKGFSIGGRKLAKNGNKITEIDMTEISIVDRPSNPDAKFALAKSAKALDDEPGYLVKIKPKVSPENKALAKMAKIVEGLAKANPPAAHDGFSLPAKTEKNASPKDNSEQNNKSDGPKPCEEHGVINCEKCAVAKREFDEKQRQEAADSGAAMPDGSFPIKNIGDLKNAIKLAGNAKDPAKAKAHIRARAKALGAEASLPEDWSETKKPNKKQAKKLAKAQMNAALDINGESFLFLKKAKSAEKAAPVIEDLKKGMNTAGSLVYCFDSIRNAQRSLMIEAKREGGDMKDKALANQLGDIAKQLATVISQKAEHEGGEAVDLSDVDDQYMVTIIGEDFNMDKVMQNTGGSGDALTDAVALLMKRAAQPTRAQRMASAADNVKKSRKACKAAKNAIEEAHKMHKTAYMAKAAKTAKGEKDDGEFDHAGAMEKLTKAYAEIDKARTFGKAASAQIEKAAGRSGQSGQEAGDSDSGFYEVPAGVKDLTPAALSGASPGGDGNGSQPPMYPGDGSVFPGKAAGGSNDLLKYAKNGQISAEVAELVMKNARAEGELEALRRMPAAGSGGRRPYAFDMSKIVGGTGGGAGVDTINKALFDGVDPGALNSNDERTHTDASAKVIGNFLTSGHFGKSVFDPAFKGAAGSGR